MRRIPKFAMKMVFKLYFSAFSVSPKSKRKICERWHANIRHIAARTWKNVQARTIVAKMSDGENIKRQFGRIP